MEEEFEKRFSWGPVAVAAALIGMTALAFWIVKDKKNQKERDVTLAQLDQELSVQEQALKDERRKLDDMTKAVEERRMQIQYGAVKDGKAAVDDFNKKAAEQRAEREKYLQMADQYNQKVAKYRDLQR